MLLNERAQYEILYFRVEFEVSVDLSEEEAPSIMDEDEWTDRNFGNSSLVLEGGDGGEKKGDVAASAKAKDRGGRQDGAGGTADADTSDDSISDLDTDTDSDEEEEDEEAGSRPLTSNEARQLQKEWIKKYDPDAAVADDDEELSKYENVRRGKAR